MSIIPTRARAIATPIHTGGRAYRTRNNESPDTGLKLEDIRAILDRSGGNAFGVLKRRLLELDAEISTLRNHQQAILKLLGNKDIRKGKMITKQKWVSIRADTS